jgi:hypothetical protein
MLNVVQCSETGNTIKRDTESIAAIEPAASEVNERVKRAGSRGQSSSSTTTRERERVKNGKCLIEDNYVMYHVFAIARAFVKNSICEEHM